MFLNSRRNAGGTKGTGTKIVELLGVSRWTVARRVEQHGQLGDIRGFDYLPDEELDEIISTYITVLPLGKTTLEVT